jgi:hypothetical protein
MDDCQFCSVISQINGEDPIGSANRFDRLIALEIPLPWEKEKIIQDPLFQLLRGGFMQLAEQQLRLAFVAIAPDRDYSVPDRARIICYQRPDRPFGTFDRREFLVPLAEMAAVTSAFLSVPDWLVKFDRLEQPPTHTRDLMICTHGNIDVACARFGAPIYHHLRHHHATEKLRVWRCSHFGGHQFAPTLMDLPTGQVWGHLKLENLANLVDRDRSVSELRSRYRGWAGASKFAQIVEREIWQQVGWEWLDYAKTEQLLAIDRSTEHPDWAEVRLEFIAPDGTLGAYEARVEGSGTVMTAINSGEEPIAMKQYRVTRCLQVK